MNTLKELFSHWLYDNLLCSGNMDRQLMAVFITATICSSFFALLYLVIQGTASHLSFSPTSIETKLSPLANPIKTKRFDSFICPHDEQFLFDSSKTIKPTGYERIPLEPVLLEPKFAKTRFEWTNSEFCSKSQTHLDLRGHRLIQCPSRLGYCGAQLSCLDLSHNSLINIPDNLACLTGLNVLYLQENCLESLPIVLSSLPIFNLDVSSNRFNDIPACIPQMTKLKYTNLARNCLLSLTSCPLITIAPITHLNLSANRIHRIPPGFFTGLCAGLVTLNLASNFLSDLPSSIRCLQNLKELDLSNNQLHSLTPSLCRCGQLRTLLLSHNKLRNLPVDLGRLSRMIRLDVSHNSLCVLPMSLFYVNLREFTVNDNPWTNQQLSWPTERTYCRQKSRKVPRLVDICATFINQFSVHWSEEDLPCTLSALLASVTRCLFCSTDLAGPRQLRVNLISFAGTLVPFYEARCTSEDVSDSSM